MAKKTKVKIKQDVNLDFVEKTKVVQAKVNSLAHVSFVKNFVKLKRKNAVSFTSLRLESELERKLNSSIERLCENSSEEIKVLIKDKKKFKPPKKKLSWKKRLRNFSIILVLGVVTGSTLGYFYFQKINSAGKEYEAFDEADILELKAESQPDNLLKSVLGVNSLTESDMKNWLNIAKSKGITPESLTGAQNANLALYNLSLQDWYKAVGRGAVSTIATQSVYSEFLFDGNNYQSISISLGTFKKVALKATMNKQKNSVTQVSGSSIKSESATWNGSPRSYNIDDYIKLAGGTPDNVNPYIISSKTVTNENGLVIKPNVDENGELILDEFGKKTYTIELELKKVESTILYVRQMKMISELGSFPSFSDVKETFTFNEDWQLKNITVLEHYSQVAMGISAACEGTLDTDFFYTKPQE